MQFMYKNINKLTKQKKNIETRKQKAKKKWHRQKKREIYIYNICKKKVNIMPG